MEGSFGNSRVIAREIGGQFRQGTDRIVKTVVGPVCKAIWPDKTDTEVAVICGCDPRNARRYMSGELPIPVKLLIAINVRLGERFE
jgi:hypothetical protein